MTGYNLYLKLFLLAGPPAPEPVEVEYRIAAPMDSCGVEWSYGAWSWRWWVYEIYVGRISSNSCRMGHGLRFTGVAIPAGSTILSAKVKYTCSDTQTWTVLRARITGEKSVNEGQWDDMGEYQSRRGTAAGGPNDDNIFLAEQVTWDGVEAWYVDQEYESEEIGSVIQAIIDQGAWTGESGADVVCLYVDDHEDRSSQGARRVAHAYGELPRDPAILPRLWVRYQ